MANPEHVEIVKQGAEVIEKWREANPSVRLDLKEVNLGGADLSGVNLSGADLSGADLSGASLTEANLSGATLFRADLSSYLTGANLSEANLRLANLFEANLTGARLAGANLTRARLAGADLTGADLREANMESTYLAEVRGIHGAHGLETVRFDSPQNTGQQAPRGDAWYFETCERPWVERRMDWERLRTAGRLPLFGASYTALVLIPIVFYGLAFYNDKIALLRAWATQITPDHPLHGVLHQVAAVALARLHPQPIPALSFLLLISTLLLAAGATLYTLFCPPRVKEFSRDQWCDQLGQPLLHYWALAWKYRQIRLLCAACYILGGLGALTVLGTKVWNAGAFILSHTVFPWPWR